MAHIGEGGSEASQRDEWRGLRTYHWTAFGAEKRVKKGSLGIKLRKGPGEGVSRDWISKPEEDGQQLPFPGRG